MEGRGREGEGFCHKETKQFRMSHLSKGSFFRPGKKAEAKQKYGRESRVHVRSSWSADKCLQSSWLSWPRGPTLRPDGKMTPVNLAMSLRTTSFRLENGNLLPFNWYVAEGTQGPMTDHSFHYYCILLKYCFLWIKRTWNNAKEEHDVII